MISYLISFCSDLLFSHSVISDSLQLHGLQSSLSFTISRSLLKLMSIESVMPSNHLILCHPLFLLPSIFPSVRVFSTESALLIRWPKYWSFSFSIRTSSEYSGLIPLRIGWFHLLAIQETLESSPVPQFKSINSLVLSLRYGPTLTSIHAYFKNLALTRWTFVGKVMSLLFNKLSGLVIAFLPRSKGLLISWLQSPSAVILESKKIKSATLLSFTVSIVSSSIYHEVMGPDAMILVFWMLNFKLLFHYPLLLSSRDSLVLLCFLPQEWCHLWLHRPTYAVSDGCLTLMTKCSVLSA